MEFFRFGINAPAINIGNIDKNRTKYGNLLIFACFFLYMSSMAAKGVFAAEVKYIIDMWNLTQAKAQLANTFYFVTYGLVQVFLSMFMSKINMRKYLIVTVPFSALFTALMGLTTGITGIWVFFALAGAFQAGIYAGCNYILTTYLPSKLLTKANKIMNTGYAMGTVIAYLLSAFCIGFDAWSLPYYLIAGMFLVSVITFAVITTISSRFKHINEILDNKEINGDEKSIDDNDPLFTVENKKKKIIFYAVDLVMAFLITALYYSIMNFVTSTLVEVHGVSQDVSIYVSIIAPIAIIAGPMMVINACEKNKDFIREGIYFSLILIPILVALYFLYSLNVFLYLALTVVFVVIANGIKAIVISVMAFKLRKIINAGSYSAISNAVASASAGISPAVMGYVKDVAGWGAVYLTTLGITIFIILLMIVIDFFVRKNYKKTHPLSDVNK